MKKCHKILSLLLAFAMVLTMLPTPALALVSSEDETYASDLDNAGLAASVEKNAPQQTGSSSVVTSADGNVTATEVKDPAVSPELDSMESFNRFEDEEIVRVIVVLEEECLLDQGYTKDEIADNSGDVAVQYARLRSLQDTVIDEINRIVSGMMPTTYGLNNPVRAKYTYSIVTNAVAVEVPYAALKPIQEISGVSSAYVAAQYSLPETEPSFGAASPTMISTQNLCGTAQAWNVGYTGAGTRIAIIDTGIDPDHPSFVDAPELTENSLGLEELRGVIGQLNASKYFEGLAAEHVYHSEKIPFGFNYVDCSVDFSHDNDKQGDHGSHVAGIAAANKIDSTDVVGVAPDAQIIVMKVFGNNGGAYEDDFIAAIEDSFLLNCDAVNLSLGSPAGFTHASEDHFDDVIKRVEDSDMIASFSAGNNYSAAAGNYWYENAGVMSNQTKDPDNGVISSPATQIGGTVVASLENATTLLEYMLDSNGDKVPYYDNAAVEMMFRTVMVGEQTYVVIPGYGEAKDFEGIDVAGKIALISRGGGVQFTDKQTNAYNAGAAACIVYNNVDGDLTGMQDAGKLPNVTVSKAVGERLKELAGADGVGTLTVTGKQDVFENAVAGKMSDFSSWGVSPDLRLLPDITALGGNILSCYDDGQYGIMSGTSMAAPHIAGMSALMMQYLHDKEYSILKNEHDYHVVAEALLMSTAVPVIEFDDVPYSPRKQGAGAANIYNAVSSPVYLTVDGDKPSASMGEDETKSGVYNFTFELNNLTNVAQTYTLSGIAMTDKAIVLDDGTMLMGETSKELDAQIKFAVYDAGNAAADYNGDGTANKKDVQNFLNDINAGSASNMAFDLVADGVLNTADAQALYKRIGALDTNVVQSITVPANSTVSVMVNVTLTYSDKFYMDTYYQNGIYVDGFVYCTSESGSCDLSLPFMGFYGDWSAARVLDTYSWYHDGSKLVERYNSALLTEDYTVIGGNPYASTLASFVEDGEEYEYEAHAPTISPNGDGIIDSVDEVYISLMRNAKLVRFTWKNAVTGEIIQTDEAHYVRQSVWQAGYGSIMPSVYSWWDLTPPDFSKMKDGDAITMTVEAYLDDGDNICDDTYSTTIYCDTQVPELTRVDVKTATNGDRTLNVEISENDGISIVLLMTQAGDVLDCLQPTIKSGKASFNLDISDYDTKFQLMVADYAGNSTTYEVVCGDGNPHLRDDAFYSYRLKINYPYNGQIYRLDDYNGWHSFITPEKMRMHTSMYDSGETAIIAAEYVDGYIIGVDAMNRLFTMKAGDWSRNYLKNPDSLDGYCYITVWGDVTDCLALDMAYDAVNKTLYVITDENEHYAGIIGGHLLTVDLETGFCTDLGVLDMGVWEYAEYEYLFGAQGLTLACDNEGNLYTVGYVSDAVFDLADMTMPEGFKEQYSGILFKIDREELVKLQDEETREEYYDDVTFEYMIPVERIGETKVGDTRFFPDYRQSMTYDHEAEKLYWMANTGLYSYFFEVDTTNAKLTQCGNVEYSSWMTALVKPSDFANGAFGSAELTGIQVSNEKVAMNIGSKYVVNVFPQPFYAQLGEISWAVTDESVVTVKDGVLTAGTKEGSTTVTVSTTLADGSVVSVEILVEVKAFEADLTLFDNSNGYWMSAPAGNINNSSAMANAIASGAGFASAAYFNGNVYAMDGIGGFYRADPETMQGTKIGSSDIVLTGMAFNYNDCYMYGVSTSSGEGGGGSSPYFGGGLATATLYCVSLKDGQLLSTPMGATPSFPMTLDSTGEYYAGIYLGGLAIDEDGYFYAVYSNEETWGYMLVKLELTDSRRDPLQIVDTYELNSELFGMLTNYTTMVYADNGIYLSDCFGKIFWIDLKNLPEEGEELTVVTIGTLGGLQNMGMVAIPAEDPELNDADAEELYGPDQIMVIEGLTVSTEIDVYPVNSYPELLYSIPEKDKYIASVDKDGNLKGLQPGETVLTVKVAGNEAVYTEIPVVVKESTGYIYGYMMTDFGYGSQTFVRFSDKAPSTDYNSDLQYIGNWMVYAGTYYDGLLYTYAQDFTNELTKDCYLVVFDSVTYQVVNKPVRIPYTIRDMAFDYTDGNLYGIVSSAELRGAVAQIDIETGEVTIIGDTGYNLVAMTIDAEGNMYAVESSMDMAVIVYPGIIEDGYVYVDYAADLGIDVGNMTQSMHYDRETGNIYWAAVTADGVSSLRLIDVETGTSGSLGLVGASGMQLSTLYTISGDEPVRDPQSAEVTGVTVTEKASTYVGGTTQLSAKVLLKYAMTTSGAAGLTGEMKLTGSTEDLKINWTSSNSEVATVDENGLVTGKKDGTAEITVTAGEFSATCMVTITAEKRAFFAYDRTDNLWVTFAEETPNQATPVSGQELYDYALQATLYVPEEESGYKDKLYGFNDKGLLYSISFDTFVREAVIETSIYDALLESAEWNGAEWWYTSEDSDYITIVDFAYDPWWECFYVAIVVDGSDTFFCRYGLDGTAELLNMTPFRNFKPSNLAVQDGMLIWVDDFVSGWIYRADTQGFNLVPEEYSYTSAGSWGYYNGSAALWEDPLTGTYYVVRGSKMPEEGEDGKWYGSADLWTIDLHDGLMTKVGSSIIGNGGHLIMGVYLREP